jgi:hypothetical protein
MHSSIQLTESDVNAALAHAPMEGKSLSVRLDEGRLLLVARGVIPFVEARVNLHARPPTPDGLVAIHWTILKPAAAAHFSSVIAEVLRSKLASLPALANAVLEITAERILLDPSRLRIGAVVLGEHADIVSLALAPPSGAAVELTFRLK